MAVDRIVWGLDAATGRHHRVEQSAPGWALCGRYATAVPDGAYPPNICAACVQRERDRLCAYVADLERAISGIWDAFNPIRLDDLPDSTDLLRARIMRAAERIGVNLADLDYDAAATAAELAAQHHPTFAGGTHGTDTGWKLGHRHHVEWTERYERYERYRCVWCTATFATWPSDREPCPGPQAAYARLASVAEDRHRALRDVVDARDGTWGETATAERVALLVLQGTSYSEARAQVADASGDGSEAPPLVGDLVRDVWQAWRAQPRGVDDDTLTDLDAAVIALADHVITPSAQIAPTEAGEAGG